MGVWRPASSSAPIPPPVRPLPVSASLCLTRLSFFSSFAPSLFSPLPSHFNSFSFFPLSTQQPSLGLSSLPLLILPYIFPLFSLFSLVVSSASFSWSVHFRLYFLCLLILWPLSLSPYPSCPREMPIPLLWSVAWLTTSLPAWRSVLLSLSLSPLVTFCFLVCLSSPAPHLLSMLWRRKPTTGLPVSLPCPYSTTSPLPYFLLRSPQHALTFPQWQPHCGFLSSHSHQLCLGESPVWTPPDPSLYPPTQKQEIPSSR